MPKTKAVSSVVAPTIPGYTLRTAHACGRCGFLARAEYRLPDGSARPEKLTGFDEWSFQTVKVPGGLLLFSKKHVRGRESWQPMPYDSCGFLMPSFADGSRSAIDQLCSDIRGNTNSSDLGTRISTFDPEALLGSPLVTEATEIAGRAQPLLLFASAAVVRYFFGEGKMPVDFNEASRNYLYSNGLDAVRNFLNMIGAVEEPIRG